MTDAAMGLHERIEALARLNDDPAAGGITREVFTPTYAEAAELVGVWMRGAGLAVRTDAFGNLFGRWAGTDPEAPVVLTGSHFDTTLNAGRFDGVLGVVGAIEAVQALRREGFAPTRGIEVVGWAGEEPRFGAGCIGSRAALGALSRAELDTMADRDGVTLAAALRGCGHDPDAIVAARIDPATVEAYVELHIEQGAVLESAGVGMGVVTAIAAPHDLRVTLRGAATHSGATPMALRRDALAGAAEAMVSLEALARGSASGTTVGTVGALRVAPGAINVVPGEAELLVDVRDSDLGAREAVMDAFLEVLGGVASRRGLGLEVEVLVRDTPRQCAPLVVDAVRGACADLGLDALDMVSGAYHDAMVLGARIPMGMLFVPSVGGVSHHPDELTAPEDLEHGVAVLTRTLARLAG